MCGHVYTSNGCLNQREGDTWVQHEQAETLYKHLSPPTFGRTGHKLDIKGDCVSGQHPQVIECGDTNLI